MGRGGRKEGNRERVGGILVDRGWGTEGARGERERAGDAEGERGGVERILCRMRGVQEKEAWRREEDGGVWGRCGEWGAGGRG